MKLKIALTLSLSILLKIASAQMFENASEYKQYIDQEDLKKHLSILASDEFQGRETGKEGQRKASVYLRTEFEKMGLLPVSAEGYTQQFSLIQKVLAKRTFSVNQQEMVIGEDFTVDKDRNKIELLSSDLVFVGFGITEGKYNSFKDLDVTNKVVVVLSGEPKVGEKYLLSKDGTKTKWSSKRTKLEFIRKLNPALIIYIEADYEKYKDAFKHQLESSALTLAYKNKVATEAAAIVVNKKIADILFAPNKKTYDKVIAKYTKSKKAKKALLLKSSIQANITFIDQNVMSDNVLGMIPGNDANDEHIFITAHYDHIGTTDGKVYNGADDDGSGTVALLEIAQAFMAATTSGNVPKRNIVFMAVSGEEKGLLGSTYYTDYPILDIKKTVADLNIDMIGRVDEEHKEDSNYVYIIGADKLSSDLYKINAEAGNLLDIKLDYKYNDPRDPNMFYYRSDHYNFAKKGIPIIFYFNGVHEDYHKETDEVSKINFSMLEKRTELVFYTAWELANRKYRIVVDNKNDFEQRK